MSTSCIMCTFWAHRAIVMASKIPRRLNKVQLQKGNTVLMNAQKSEIISRIEISKSSYKLGSLTVYDVKKQK